MTLVFENRDTVLFQIQEMLRVERIVAAREDAPTRSTSTTSCCRSRGEVAATLFIEITDEARIQPILDGFIGLDEPGRLVLRIGSATYPAHFAPGQSREDRISAVHYIRFRPGTEGREALASGAEAALEVAQGEYRARQVLSQDTVKELVEDLGA